MKQKRNLKEKLRVNNVLIIGILNLCLISCNTQSFKKVDFYVEQTEKNKFLIDSLFNSILSPKYENKTTLFSCDSTNSEFINIDLSLCEQLKKGNFKEAVRYNTGTVHLVYDRKLKNQNYGVFIVSFDSTLSDTLTKKNYYKNILGTKYTLVAESDW